MAAQAIREQFGQVIERLTFLWGRYLIPEVYIAQECDILLRGLRTEKERAYEASVLQSFVEEDSRVSCVLLPARPAFVHISSTEAKRVSFEGVEQALAYVPRFIAMRLAERIRLQQEGGGQCR